MFAIFLLLLFLLKRNGFDVSDILSQEPVLCISLDTWYCFYLLLLCFIVNHFAFRV